LAEVFMTNRISLGPGRLLLLVVVLLSPGGRGTSQLTTPPPSEPAAEISGALVICGGGSLPDAVLDRFVELAGGPKARIVVIPTASAVADTANMAKALEPWKKRTIASVELLHTRDREKANDSSFSKPIKEATGVWFGGGEQSRITAAYLNTAVERELKSLLERGGVIGGTSAGAAIMSQVMIAGGNPEARVAQGFGFLPGVVVDQHFLKRNRAERLFGVLARHPGLAGLGVDEETALVVKGRGLSVLGNSTVTVCLSASTTRPARTQVLKAGDHADLVALSRAALARAQPPHPPLESPVPEVAHGTLIIDGGAGMPLEMWHRFVQHAGGTEALIVIIPTAQGDNPRVDPREVHILKKVGATNVKVLHARNRKEAETPEFLAVLGQAKGVWFTGGRQWRLVDSYLDTAAEKLFHQVLQRGGVIGGSSAGASIQSSYLVRGNPLGNRQMMAEGYERGLGFLPGVAIDQHFFKRNRTKDMTELMTAHPQLLGIGIDEGATLVVRGSVMEVFGKANVAVYNRNHPVVAGEKDYEELTPGTRYDLKTRTRLGKD
jgi:cyanophycinase